MILRQKNNLLMRYFPAYNVIWLKIILTDLQLFIDVFSAVFPV